MLKPTQDKNAPLTDDEIHKISFDAIPLAEQAYPKWSNSEEWMTFCYRQVVKAQLEKLEKLGYHIGLPSHIEEALNSGDGTYRP